MGDVVHPRVRPGALEDRAYQREILAHARRENLLVVLPTGLGKTAIALRLMADLLQEQPGRSVLVMAPTRPLVEQHAQSVRRALTAPEPLVFTGAIPPERRHELLTPPQVVVATPQAVANDVAQGTLDLGAFSLVVFDEAHRAVGDYPYVELGRRLRDRAEVRVLGMTASPGAQRERVKQVLDNLGIGAHGVEVRDGSEPDVTPYLHAIATQPVLVDNPPEIRAVGLHLRRALDRQTERLRRAGYFPGQDFVGRGDLLRLGQALRTSVGGSRARGQPVPAGMWEVITAQAVAMKASHAVELAETQGVEALRQFFQRVREKPGKRPSPSDRAFLKDPDVVEAESLLAHLDLEHPKVDKVVSVVREELRDHPAARVLVFAHYRDTAQVLVEALGRDPEGLVRPARFVGQATRGEGDVGLSQREQVSLLDRFRAGTLNCLVATSVAEEGLDIPNTDLVVFYEPVPSEIRTIQRRGRTGRFRTGRVLVLVARGTRDVTSQHSSRGKEVRMRQMLEELQRERAGEGAPSRPPSPSRRRAMHRLEEFA